ncbi:MAG: thioredoxin family protein [Cyclobacteriaceae bacterium]|nr:thioredoxin family protein [Cyclobacteriaceae bacterium]
MARIPSTMMPLGTRAPEFTLPDTVSGRELSLHEIKGEKGTLVMFICNHCPFVIHVNEQLVKLGNDYQPNGIKLVAISSNDATKYPEDSPEKMRLVAKKLTYPFPYFYDETQEIAEAYDAACTPDFFLFDAEMRLVYRGQLDGARPDNDVPVTGYDLREAMDALLYGEEIPQDQKPSMGCSIKWK